MPREFKRSDRVADAIQRCLAQILQTEVRDPRLGMVNINAVSVVQDLSLAKIYVTFVGDDTPDANAEKIEVLNKASSFMRGLVAKELSTRITPRLTFVFDESVTRGRQMTDLIDRALSSDRAKHSDDEV